MTTTSDSLDAVETYYDYISGSRSESRGMSHHFDSGISPEFIQKIHFKAFGAISVAIRLNTAAGSIQQLAQYSSWLNTAASLT